MAWIQKPQVGVFAENKFLVPDFNRIAAGIIIPVNKVVLGLTADQIGSTAYSETKAGASCAIRFGKNISAGIQLDYIRMNLPEEYDDHHVITFEGGIYAAISEQLSMGIHLFNPLQSKWSQSEEQMPACIRGGMAFKPEASLSIYVEADKSTARPAILAAGVEYRYKEIFFFRAGISSGPSRYCFGAGFKLKRFIIDFASSVHSWLGYSPHMSITYSFSQ